MKRLLILSFVCLVTASSVFPQTQPCIPAQHARIPAISELTYHAARKKLLAAKWQPVRTKSFNNASSDPDISDGNGPVFWRRGYFEVEFCSGTGSASCGFLFKDVYGNQLRVTTEGEELPRQKAYARVTSFEFVCD